jgi:hypothetical protein
MDPRYYCILNCNRGSYFIGHGDTGHIMYSRRDTPVYNARNVRFDTYEEAERVRKKLELQTTQTLIVVGTRAKNPRTEI